VLLSERTASAFADYFGAFFHVKTYLRSARPTSRAFSFVTGRPRFNGGMPALTCRRSADRADCWHIYYGDVQAGTIAMRTGNPHDTDPWEWSCGFYPGSRPGEIQTGTSETFDQARAEFGSARKIFLPTAPTPIFTRGATSGIRPRGNMRCGMVASNCRRNCRPADQSALVALT
jgi:hypothetical protein